MRNVEKDSSCGVIKLKVVTSNPGKAKEFIELGKHYSVKIEIIDLPKLEIQSNSLEEIATFSAIDAATRLGTDVVVEDAGLFIEALNGFPGPYSSYVYKTLGVKGVLKLMEGINNRCAYFKSVITYFNPKDHVLKVFVGVVKGRISLEARGTEGFGFDPIFIPEGYDKTFAELGVKVKNMISHRSQAFKKLINWLRSVR